jgi:hypothetical protein
MFKWISWVVRMGATALLLSFLCIWTTGYIVNSYMESLIKQLELPIETKPFALSGIWGTLWGADSLPDKAAAPSETPKKENPTESAASTPESSTGNSEAAPTDDSQNAEPPIASPEPNQEASPAPPTSSEDTAPVFNGESAAGQLSASQRQELYAMVISKLNAEQLKLLSDSLEGGLTQQELDQVDAMLKKSLSEKEYEQMMGLLKGTVKPDLSPSTEG